MSDLQSFEYDIKLKNLLDRLKESGASGSEIRDAIRDYQLKKMERRDE